MTSLSKPPLISRLRCSSLIENITDDVSLLPKARTIVEPLLTKQPKVLKLRLFFLKQAHNHNQTSYKFQKENSVLIDTFCPAYSKERRWRQLLRKYDSPFEVIQKLSPVFNHLRNVWSLWIHLVLNIGLSDLAQMDFSKFWITSWIFIICQNFYYLLFGLSVAFNLLILLASVIIASCATPSVFKGFRSDCRQGGLCYGY